MVHHFWGDDAFDWRGLDDAISYILEFNTRWGRSAVVGKEKYGTARITLFLWYGRLECLVDPYRFVKWDTPLGWLSSKLARVLTCIGVVGLYNQYQIFIYRLSFKRAIGRWPHLKGELLQDNEDVWQEGGWV
jgi:hypothetical protein